MTRKPISQHIAEQRAWIERCGGSLYGYIQHYGSKEQPAHYGDGGEAIYAADTGHLAHLEALSKRRKYL
jgi:hypothetical protein